MKKITTIFLTIIVLVTVLSSCTGLKTKEEDTPADHDTMLESDIITSNVNSSDKDSEQSRDIEDYVLYRNGGPLAYTKYDYDKYYKGCEDYAYYCEHQPKREEMSEHNNGSLTIADIERICRENEDFLNIFKAIQEIRYYPDLVILDSEQNIDVGSNTPGGYVLVYKATDEDGKEVRICVAFRHVKLVYHATDKYENDKEVVLFDKRYT